MDTKYPLYPRLTEEGEKEAVIILKTFHDRMKKVCEETLDQFYVDVLPYIETDSWTNYRNQLMDGFRNYNNRKVQGEHDFARIREEIYKQFRDDIIKDLNQDLVKEIASLKEQIEIMHRNRF